VFPLLLGRHLMGMTARIRWNGQGFGDLSVKPGVGRKVTWVIGLPKETSSGHLAWGQAVGLRSLLPRCPNGRTKGQGRKPGNGVPAEPGNIS